MDNFIIISRDCHGNNYYNKEYNTPTIGNCIIFQEFIKFAKNINNIYNAKLIFEDEYPRIAPQCKYPIGLLKMGKTIDIHIHFMHDTDKSVILNKFNRRISRMNKNEKNYIFFLNDLDFEKSNNLQYPRYFDITNEEINSGLIDYFSIEYGKKIFFCNKYTFDKISKKVLECIEISKKGLIIIIPETLKTGGEIYNYLKSSNKSQFIFGNETGIIEL